MSDKVELCEIVFCDLTIIHKGTKHTLEKVVCKNECDLVYDPFMGSGTTAKMAIINKRNWIGSEMSKEYCQIIDERLQGV